MELAGRTGVPARAEPPAWAMRVVGPVPGHFPGDEVAVGLAPPHRLKGRCVPTGSGELLLPFAPANGLVQRPVGFLSGSDPRRDTGAVASGQRPETTPDGLDHLSKSLRVERVLKGLHLADGEPLHPRSPDSQAVPAGAFA